jgi:serine/threonine-protein kinase
MELGTGSQLLDYRLETLLGRGGMSVVYVAEDLRLRRKVAIKLLAPELAEDDRFRERFVRESELAASIDHPNVIPIYEAGEIDGCLYIAMRYVAGTDLKALLRRERRLDPARAIAMAAQVAAALDVAHRHGLVHRDVKPGNVLVSAQDLSEHVYLSDFGVAKGASIRAGLTSDGQLLGTIDYVAPEQIRGEPVDGRADQYALGCLLFECLTGDVPFRRDTEVAVIYAHLRDLPPAVSDLVSDVPAGLDSVLARALAKNPADRFETCGELAARAQAALALSRSGAMAGAVTSKARAAKPVREILTRVAIAIGLAIVLAIALGGGGVSTPHSAIDSAATLTGTYETRISGETAEDAGLTGTWRLQFLPGGAVRAIWNGVTVVRGSASVTGTQVKLTDEAGSEACRGPEATGVYRWELREGLLTLTPLRDLCRPRRIVALMRSWTRVD